MIDQGKHTSSRAVAAVLPGFCLILTVLAFNLAGDWLRDCSTRPPRSADR